MGDRVRGSPSRSVAARCGFLFNQVVDDPHHPLMTAGGTWGHDVLSRHHHRGRTVDTVVSHRLLALTYPAIDGKTRRGVQKALAVDAMLGKKIGDVFHAAEATTLIVNRGKNPHVDIVHESQRLGGIVRLSERPQGAVEQDRRAYVVHRLRVNAIEPVL